MSERVDTERSETWLATVRWRYLHDADFHGAVEVMVRERTADLVAIAEAAEKLRALHVKRDQMIDNDTWESEGAIPTYKAIANAEVHLATALERGRGNGS